MKRFRFIGVLAILVATVSCTVDEEPQPIQTQQVTSQVPLATRFKHAVEMLDSYRGNTSLLESARVELEGVLNEDRRHAPAHRELARYFIMRGHISGTTHDPTALQTANSQITTAIEIDPNDANTYVLLGHLKELMGRPEEARVALAKAESLGTGSPWLDLNWASLLLEEGKYEEAAQRYRKVIDSKTPNMKAMMTAHEGLIKYYRNAGKLDQADEIYREQLRQEPNAPWSRANYAQFLLCERDDYEQSIIRAREALSIMEFGVARFWLASALYRKWAQTVLSGRNVDRESFEEAKTLYPDLDEIAVYAEGCPPLKSIADARARSSGHPPKR